MIQKLRFIGVTKDAQTAGPGKRLELFTKGCIRGVLNPCEGCFNESSWTFEGEYKDMSVSGAVSMIERDAWNRQVTFCGGEPILQSRIILEVVKKLKKLDPTFHFVLYTAYKLDTLMKYGLKFTWLPRHGEGMRLALEDYSESTYKYVTSYEESNLLKQEFTILTPEDVQELMEYIDIIVDGDYKHELRMTSHPTMHDGGFIGSSNQRVIFGPETLINQTLVYQTPTDFNQNLQNNHTCTCCGHVSKREFCNDTCENRYQTRKKEMALVGGV